MKTNKNNDELIRLITLIGIFLTALLILCLRNLDPIIYPTLYAEDGALTASLKLNGFFSATFESRTYPILGLTALYAIGGEISRLFFGPPIFYLPLAYYLVSNIFMAVVATIAYLQARALLSFASALTIFLSVVLQPVGTDGNEIYGRILNLGFFFPYLQMLLLIPIMMNNPTKGQILVAACFSLISGLTLPVGIAITFSAVGCLFLRYFVCGKNFKDAKLLLLFLLVGLISILIFSITLLKSDGSASQSFKLDSFIEFVVARSAIYLIVFSFYEYLNNAVSLMLAMLLTLTILWCLWRSFGKEEVDRKQPGFEYILLLLVCSSVFYLIAMVIFRSGLTHFLDGYTGTWPDRYFTGINLTFFTMTIFVLHNLRVIHGFRFARSIPIVLALPLIISAGQRFEFSKPHFKLEENLSWTGEICDLASNSKDGIVSVPIPPLGWFSAVQADENRDLLLKRCGVSNDYYLAHLDAIFPNASLHKGVEKQEDDMRIASFYPNNGVDVILKNNNTINVKINGADPSLILRTYSEGLPRDVRRKLWIKVTMDTPGEFQLFYLTKGNVGFSEAESIRIPVRGLTDQFHIYFSNRVETRELRLDFPEGVGKEYVVEFDDGTAQND
jgi:hypothetical protein